MAKVKVHAGDFKKKAESSFLFGQFSLYLSNQEAIEKAKEKGKGIFGQAFAANMPVTYSAKDIEEIDLASEESVKKIGGTVGWGVAGAVVLGPAGMLAGLLLGGKKKEVTFVCRFKDGKKLLATVDSKTWKKIQAATF